jgi:cyclohexadieny/prephenate dehydrogenase
MLPFERVSIIGLGLIGSSVARAVRANMPSVRLTGHDGDAQVRGTAVALNLCDDVTDTPGAAVTDADLVILCVPVGAMGDVAQSIAGDLPADAIVSDVGSSKAGVAAALAKALPNAVIIPAHPVAGTERSGPEAGFATLFHQRWCIVTPPEGRRKPPSSASAASGSGWGRTSRSWTPRITTWCWRSPAICRT